MCKRVGAHALDGPPHRPRLREGQPLGEPSCTRACNSGGCAHAQPPLHHPPTRRTHQSHYTHPHTLTTHAQAAAMLPHAVNGPSTCAHGALRWGGCGCARCMPHTRVHKHTRGPDEAGKGQPATRQHHCTTSPRRQRARADKPTSVCVAVRGALMTTPGAAAAAAAAACSKRSCIPSKQPAHRVADGQLLEFLEALQRGKVRLPLGALHRVASARETGLGLGLG